jgi:hypothetical protein
MKWGEAPRGPINVIVRIVGMYHTIPLFHVDFVECAHSDKWYQGVPRASHTKPYHTIYICWAGICSRVTVVGTHMNGWKNYGFLSCGLTKLFFPKKVQSVRQETHNKTATNWDRSIACGSKIFASCHKEKLIGVGRYNTYYQLLRLRKVPP